MYKQAFFLTACLMAIFTSSPVWADDKTNEVCRHYAGSVSAVPAIASKIQNCDVLTIQIDRDVSWQYITAELCSYSKQIVVDSTGNDIIISCVPAGS